MIGDYVIQKEIGEGSFGTVQLASHQLTGEKVAVKISTESEILREYEILANLIHPNIISVKHVLKIPLEVRSKVSHNRGMVMDYIEGGDLISFISKSGPISEMIGMKFLVQILSALSHCHKNRIAHQDIKPDNILFDSKTGNLLLCDFGLATFCAPTRFLHGKVGSLLYCAPEVLSDLPYLGPQVDIWAAGVVFYSLVSGCLPWEGAEIDEQLENAVVGNYYKLKHISTDCSEILASMLTTNADRRPTADELIDRLAVSLTKYNSPRSILFNQSQYVEEDGAGANISWVQGEDEESSHSPSKTSPKVIPKYNLRVVTESEIKNSSICQLAYVDMEILCKSLERSFEVMNIDYKTNNRKKSWVTTPCYKYQCKNGQSRFDIEICTTKDKKSNTKVIMCRNIKGDHSNAMSLLNQLCNKTPNI